MWTCPKCNREFKAKNQHHFCAAIVEIDQYIAEQSKEVQPILEEIRKVLQEEFPDSIEKISWRMPTYWQKENLIHFAAFKNHVSIFPGGEASTVFANELEGYKTAKGTIQFPLNKPIPYDLIRKIARWRLSQVQ